MQSAFSRVGKLRGPSSKGRVIVPVTALPCGGFRWRVTVFMVAIFMLVGVIDPEQCSGEGGDLSETDEERFMDLSLRVDEDSAVEHDHTSDREYGCRDELYVGVVFHKYSFSFFLIEDK